MKKRGQFFILAAVILSAVIVGLATVKNYVNINKEPEKFYDLTYEVKGETANVIDYGIYNPEPGAGEKLYEFLGDIAEDLRDRDPEAGFVFIYGNQSEVKIDNYLKTDIEAEGETTEGGAEDIPSEIAVNIGGVKIEKKVIQEQRIFREEFRKEIEGEKDITIKIDERDYQFELGEGQQFYIIITKTVGEEEFVDVK